MTRIAWVLLVIIGCATPKPAWVNPCKDPNSVSCAEFYRAARAADEPVSDEAELRRCVAGDARWCKKAPSKSEGHGEHQWYSTVLCAQGKGPCSEASSSSKEPAPPVCTNEKPDDCWSAIAAAKTAERPNAEIVALAWTGCSAGDGRSCEEWLGQSGTKDAAVVERLCKAGFARACESVTARLCLEGKDRACAAWVGASRNNESQRAHLDAFDAACVKGEGPWCLPVLTQPKHALGLCKKHKRVVACAMVVKASFDKLEFLQAGLRKGDVSDAFSTLQQVCRENPKNPACERTHGVQLQMAREGGGVNVDVVGIVANAEKKCSAGVGAACADIIYWSMDLLFEGASRRKALELVRTHKELGDADWLRQILAAEPECKGGKLESCTRLRNFMFVRESPSPVLKAMMGRDPPQPVSEGDAQLGLWAAEQACRLSPKECHEYALDASLIRGVPLDLRKQATAYELACNANSRHYCQEHEELKADLEGCQGTQTTTCEKLMERHLEQWNSTSAKRAAEIGNAGCARGDQALCAKWADALASGDGLPRDLAAASILYDKLGSSAVRTRHDELVHAWRACEWDKTKCSDVAIVLAHSKWRELEGGLAEEVLAFANRACAAGGSAGCVIAAGLPTANQSVMEEVPAEHAAQLRKHCAKAAPLCRAFVKELAHDGVDLAAANNRLFVELQESMCSASCYAACESAAKIHVGGYPGVAPDAARAKNLRVLPKTPDTCPERRW